MKWPLFSGSDYSRAQQRRAGWPNRLVEFDIGTVPAVAPVAWLDDCGAGEVYVFIGFAPREQGARSVNKGC